MNLPDTIERELQMLAVTDPSRADAIRAAVVEMVDLMITDCVEAVERARKASGPC